MLMSFVVPVYNTEKYLSKCLESILNQTCQDFEIIAINDGSTDQSGKILRKYEEKYGARFRVIEQTNHGIGYTRNKGIEVAKGKYITFIDSDDCIELQYCEMLCEKAEEDQLDMVVCDYFEVMETTGDKKLIQIKDFSITSLKENPKLLFEINSSPWNKIYRTDILKEYGIRFPESLKYEDVVFVLESMEKSNKIGKVCHPLVNYLIRDGSETTVMNESVFDIFKIMDRVCDFYQKEGCYQAVKKDWEWFCINRIMVYCIQQRYQKNKDKALRFIDEGYSYLNENYPGWMRNQLYRESNNIMKRMLKNHRCIMKLFVRITKKRI